MRGVLFYIVTIGFAVGVFARSLFIIDLPTLTWVLFLSVVLAFLWRRNGEQYFLYGSVVLLAMVLGMLRFDIATWDEPSHALTSNIGQEISYEGVIVREPDQRERTTHLYVAVDDELLLVFADRYTNVSYGDRVRIIGVLNRPESFETDLGRTFNYPGYLEARGVRYMVQFADVSVLRSGEGHPIFATLFSFKHAFMQKIELLIPSPQVGLGEGLLLGVKQALGDDLENAFRKTGIIHIVVLSGYNIMLVVAFVLFVFSFFFGLRTRMVFGILAIMAFALMVGLSATVVRASIMAGLALVVLATGHTYVVLRALLLAGVVMLLVNPYLLVFDVGFQLSFVATLGLIFLAPIIERYVQFVPSLGGMRLFLVATLATQIFVLPVLLYQIGELSVVSVLVNMLVLPMVPVAMLLTFATGMLGFISTSLALPFAYLAHLSLSYIIVVAEYFGSFSYAAFAVPAFPFWVVPLMYAVLGYGIWKLWNPKESGEGVLEGWTIEEVFDDETKESDATASDSKPFFLR